MAAIAQQSDYPQNLVGKTAPELRFESVLHNGKLSKIKPKLKGRVTLLEFWFVNCGACRQAVPHFNRLVRKFGPKGLQSFAITFESAVAARKYLEEVPLAAPVGIDTARQTIKRYGVTGYPHTFLIGRDGKVISSSGPESITEKVLADALAGRRVKLEPIKEQTSPELDPESTSAPSFSATVSSRKGASFSITPERVAFLGVSLRQAIQYLYALTPNQFDMKLQPDENLYDLRTQVPGGKNDAALKLMKASLERKFKISVKVEMRDQKVAVFRKNGPLKGVTPWDGKKQRGATGDDFTGQTLGSIVESVGYMMGLIGVDETNDKGLYDFRLTLQTSPSFEQQVKEMFGLDVTRETRKLPFTIVRQSK